MAIRTDKSAPFSIRLSGSRFQALSSEIREFGERALAICNQMIETAHSAIDQTRSGEKARKLEWRITHARRMLFIR